MLQILPSHQINKLKWDTCVASNSNGLIYANSMFLDAMASNWYGCIINHYETIFPLCVKNKCGIQYLYTPPFLQQLGIIGDTQINVNELTKKIIQQFKYGSTNINFSNTIFAQHNQCITKNNLIISLNQSIDNIRNNYTKNAMNHLSKANKLKLLYASEFDIKWVVNAYKKHNAIALKHISDKDYNNLLQLLNTLQQANKIIIRKVMNDANELLSVVLLLTDDKRLYNLIPFTNANGRANNAGYFLYDNIFNEFAQTPMLFDFEGSELPGVKTFYEKFGATSQPYFLWHYNKLPFYIKWLKQ